MYIIMYISQHRLANVHNIINGIVFCQLKQDKLEVCLEFTHSFIGSSYAIYKRQFKGSILSDNLSNYHL